MLHYKSVAKTRFRKSADVLLCIFGLVVMVYTTSLTIISWVSGHVEPSLPSYCDKQKLGQLFAF
jgi:proton-coupled amino acid transporter